jgi:hypothetical protein
MTSSATPRLLRAPTTAKALLKPGINGGAMVHPDSNPPQSTCSGPYSLEGDGRLCSATKRCRAPDSEPRIDSKAHFLLTLCRSPRWQESRRSVGRCQRGVARVVPDVEHHRDERRRREATGLRIPRTSKVALVVAWCYQIRTSRLLLACTNDVAH